MTAGAVTVGVDLGQDMPAYSLTGEGVEFIATGERSEALGAAALCLADYALMLEGGPAQIFHDELPAGSIVLVNITAETPDAVQVEVGGKPVSFARADLARVYDLVHLGGTLH